MPKPKKTRTVTEKAWGLYDKEARQLLRFSSGRVQSWPTRARAEHARQHSYRFRDSSLFRVVRVTLNFEVSDANAD